MIEFVIQNVGGVRVVEGAPGEAMLARGSDVNQLLEACFNGRARAALLHAENLPSRFFDLSSGEAGEMLQKLQSYGGIRLAVVAAPGVGRPSTRFGEMAAEARWKGTFAIFADVASARAWLASGSEARISPETGGSLAAQLVGHWTLVSLAVVNGTEVEYPMGRDLVGAIAYDESGHMAVQIMRRDRPRFASDDVSAGTFAELSAAVTGYTAYFGTYSVDERAHCVTHHVDGSLFPNWVGTEQRREVVLEGDELTLSSRPILFNGQPRVFRAVWTRRR